MDTVIIFGRGNFFRKNILEIEKKNKISVFIGNDEETKISENIYNFKDFDFSQLKSNQKILVMVYSFCEVIKQLLDIGVNKENILIGLNHYGLSYKDKIRRKAGKFDIDGQTIVFRSALIGNKAINNMLDVENIDNMLIRLENPLPFDITKLGMKPIDELMGFGRGKSISRYYIDRFIESKQDFIKGDVMEIGDNHYTKIYNSSKISNRYILHVNGGKNCIKGDLQTGEGIRPEMVDCFILTQVLDCIYNLHSSCQNIINALKKNGVALITVAGISQISKYDMDRWGHYWNFTDLSLKRLFGDIVGEENVQVETYGNVKTAMMRLYGGCQEDLTIEDLSFFDKNYQVIIGAVVKKP